MSFLSKILAKRKDKRPPKRSAAHIPRGIATERDHNDYWNGPSLGPDVIPAIPRSPIDYAFNQERQVWQPQPRPVSPILPIQAEQRQQDRYPLRHQASTGDLGRVKHFMSSPTASSFSSTSLSHLVDHNQPSGRAGQQRSNGSTPDDWPLSPTAVRAPPRQEPSRTPSPLSTQDSCDDVGTLPIERPNGSTVSPLEGSSSAGSETSLVEDMLARFQQRGELLLDQEEFVELPRTQQQQQQQQQRQQQRQQQQHRQPPQNAELHLPDQVEYVSDGGGSDYEDENDEHEAQGLGHFSSRSLPTSTQAKALVSGPFPLDRVTEHEVSDAENQAGPFEYDRLAVRVGDQYISKYEQQEQQDGTTDDDDTVSELSSYSAAAAAFPLVSQSIGVATSIDPIDTTTDRIVTTFANLSPSTTNEHVGSSFADLSPSTEHSNLYEYASREYFPVATPTALSPPPQHSNGFGSFRFTDTSAYDRASSDVINFAPGGVGQLSRDQDDERGRTSWVSSVSSYYGPIEDGGLESVENVSRSYGVPYSGP